MRSRPILSICMLSILCLLSACGKPNATGKYLAKFSDGIKWLQLVETPDGHLSGQLEEVMLHKDGKIEHNSIAVSGVTDQENISISFKPISLIPYEIASSGTLDGNKLKLLMNGTLIEFQRVKFDDYQDQLDILNKQAKVILAVDQENKFIVGLDNFTGRMARFNNYVDTHIDHGPILEQRYHSITTKMETYLARERSLTANPHASYERGEIAYSINEGAYATEQIHDSVQSAQQDLQTKGVPMMKQLEEYELICQSNQMPGFGTNTVPDTKALSTHCELLTKTDPIFRQKFKSLATSLDHLDQVYQQENKKQVQLVQESKRIK